MTSELYNLLVTAIGDYLGKPLQLGENASNFYIDDEFIFRLWSDDNEYVWVINVVPAYANAYYNAFFNLYKKDDAPSVLQKRIKMEGLLDSADIQIIFDEKKMTYQFRKW